VAVGMLACIALARPKWSELSKQYTYNHYLHDFGKKYDNSKEFEERKAIFEENLQIILTHNANPNVRYHMGLNHMTDWTPHEKKSMLGYRGDLAAKHVQERDKKFASGELKLPQELMKYPAPIAVDWRGKGILTAVKDQGQCGSCWSFSSAETLESHYALATGLLNVLSEQQILSCTPNPDECGGTGGCAGGTTEVAYDYLMSTGSTSEWNYPYLSYYGKDQNCYFNSTKMSATNVPLTSYQGLPSNNYSAVLNAVAFIGPLALSVDASSWVNYESGIFDGCDTTNPDINHGVQLVGYGASGQGEPFWIIRNSWSPTFGEEGYIRVYRDYPPVCGVDTTPRDGTGCIGGPPNVTVCGMCGVLFDAVYPIVGLN